MSSMFWGLRLEPGKRYTATVDKPFHVSMAALDCASITNDDIQTVMLEEESNTPFILCNLQRHKVLQARLDLNFVPGNRVTFFCRGTGSVHLTGYILPEDDDCTFDDGEEEEDDEQAEEEDDDDVEEEEDDREEEEDDEQAEEEDDDDVEEEEDDIDDEEDFADLKRVLRKAHRKQDKLNGVSSKRKSEGASGLPDSKKKKISQKKESEDDSDDDVEAEEEEAANFDEEGEEEQEEADSDDDTGNTDETFSPPVQEKKSKKKKKNKQKQGSPQQEQQQGKQKQNATNGSPQEFAGQQKKKAKLEGGNEKSDSPRAKTLDNGVSIKDTKIGNGPVCKPGKQVTVYYTGRLKSNNKVFDQSQQGPGFTFRLGRGEVIKGWDIGVVGMKVGGKRRLTCPASAAYGHKGSPPTIPPNSTLIFDVEVRAVN